MDFLIYCKNLAWEGRLVSDKPDKGSYISTRNTVFHRHTNAHTRVGTNTQVSVKI